MYPLVKSPQKAFRWTNWICYYRFNQAETLGRVKRKQVVHREREREAFIAVCSAFI